MDITTLARKAELIQIVLDSPDIVEIYGDSISFWMRDFIDVTSYFNFFKAQADGDAAKLGKLLTQMVLKEAGTPAMAVDDLLPIDIQIAMLTEINTHLGKSKTSQWTPEVGTQ
jgi:hypothetical protein